MLTATARRWVFPALPDPTLVDRIARELRLPPALCRLLVHRGYGEPAAVREFLRPHLGQIHPPLGMAGMAEAVERIVRAIRGGETILVHGDYDVDGICSTAVFVRSLRMMGAQAEPFVPHRLQDGYDLSEAGIRAARAIGAGLILTGDCGIVAHEAVRRACSLGIDVVVTDHHTPGPTLPDCVAVVDPNRADCPYPDKSLAGVGVAWKVCCAVADALGFPAERLQAFLDLVAVATVADLAPLTGENRALVRWGLRVLPETPNPGLRALLRTTGLAGKEVSAVQVGYVLAPRINAVGRMGEARDGVRLLLTDDAREAEAIAHALEAENRARQAVDADTLRQAMDGLERWFDPDRHYGIVLAEEGWHPGVIGIVASRVVERIHRPTVLIALAGADDGKGSARSIPGFHLHEAMSACSGSLTRFGGHRMAAGCSIRPGRVDDFREAFDAHAHAVLNPEQLVPEVRVDLEVELRHADDALARMLRHAGPFGPGNPTPVFAARGVFAAAPPRVVGEKHLRLTLASHGSTMEAIGFNLAGLGAEPWVAGGAMDVAFRLEENHWNGRTSLQAKIVDLRPSED
jgi:single-stranded-DNA-specific exonuclease